MEQLLFCASVVILFLVLFLLIIFLKILFLVSLFHHNYPARAARAGLSDRVWCPYIYVCGRKKNLNRTLEINSPFQTFAVGLLVEFID